MNNHLVLILAYHFPPENAIGAARPFRFAKYLSRMGYTCHVFTAADQFGRADPNIEYVPDPFVASPRSSLRWQIERAVRKVFCQVMSVCSGLCRLPGRLARTSAHTSACIRARALRFFQHSRPLARIWPVGSSPEAIQSRGSPTAETHLPPNSPTGAMVLSRDRCTAGWKGPSHGGRMQ